jgi:hypothetical protein
MFFISIHRYMYIYIYKEREREREREREWIVNTQDRVQMIHFVFFLEADVQISSGAMS